MRPQSCPDPTSRFLGLSLANPTIVSRTALMAAPSSSGAGGSPGGTLTGRGARSPTITAGSLPGDGGSDRPNQAVCLDGACAAPTAGDGGNGASRAHRTSTATTIRRDL